VRKWLVFLGVILIAVWLVMWIGAGVMARLYTTDTERVWPRGLGTLADARKRYPPAPVSPAGYELAGEAAKVGIDIAPRNEPRPPELSPRSNLQVRSALTKYLNSEIQKTTPEIDAPPAELADYLAANAGHLASIRAILLGDEEVAWSVEFGSRRAPLPNLGGHMFLSRALLSNALDRARRGEAGAWDDARAATALSRGLWQRPELISALIALAIDRNVNAVARKLPLPVPAWFAEFQKFDYTAAMIASRQAEAWAISEAIHAETSADDYAGPGHRRAIDTILSPYTRLCTADSLDADRRVAIAVAETRTCDVNQWAFFRQKRELLAWWNAPGRRISTANLDAAWQRLFRFRAELEATDRALRLRAGQPRIETSGCSDGRWNYTENGFRFSREISSPAPAAPMPLEFQLN
jgi:hypothetical protein